MPTLHDSENPPEVHEPGAKLYRYAPRGKTIEVFSVGRAHTALRKVFIQAMGNLKKRIEGVIVDDGKSPFFSLEHLLCYPAALYERISTLRAFLFKTGRIPSRKLPCMVISIGNITVGGTGKTPMTVYTAELIRRLGHTVAIVSRGYGGKLSKEGGIVSDGEKILLGPEMAGDEPYMMAMRLRGVPVVIGSCRYSAGMTAVEAFSPDVILLDDGFQHLKLKRDLDILLMDSTRPFGNGCLLPRGTLREPVGSLARADLLFLSRCGEEPVSASSLAESVSDPELKKRILSLPVFGTSHKPYVMAYIKGEGSHGPSDVTGLESGDFLNGRRVFAFSGIAKNDDFRRTVAGYGSTIKGWLEFSDHHYYSEMDFKRIEELAIQSGAELILTTEKDYVRIAQRASWSLPLVVIGVDICFKGDEELFGKIMEMRIIEYWTNNGRI